VLTAEGAARSAAQQSDADAAPLRCHGYTRTHSIIAPVNDTVEKYTVENGRLQSVSRAGNYS